MRQHGLEKIFKVPTRGSCILDVFLTNSPVLWKQGTAHTGLVRSDHLAVTVSLLVPGKPSRKYFFFRDPSIHRKMAMDRKLKECDLNFADTLDDPEECVRIFNDKLWAIFDERFPPIKIKMSSRDPPYKSPLVKHLCNLRNKISRSRVTVVWLRIKCGWRRLILSSA